MRVLVVASVSKAEVLENAFRGISGTYQRVSPSKLKLDVLERLKPDVLIADISNPDTLENQIIIEGAEGFRHITVYTEVDKNESALALRKSILREVRIALPDIEFDAVPETSHLAVVSDIPPVWIIGASSGGPGVLMDLFSKATPGQAAIIIALHIDKQGFDNYRELLTDKASTKGWEILISSDKPFIKAGSILLVHPDDEIEISVDGRVKIEPAQDDSKFFPLINNVIKNVIESRSDCGTIILTGIGTDGASAIQKYKNKLVRVIAQDASAPLSSMPDACRKAGGESLGLDKISEVLSAGPR